MKRLLVLTLLIFIMILSACSNHGYTELLQDYALYQQEEAETPYDFTYADPADENLVKLKKEYNLEEAAGNGDELSRIINLMRWAHGVARHDGTSQNPFPQNSLNIIKVCREEDRGVNCRMMATVLNEAYLAMGFKSRHVTCLPFDKDDRDCHVINIVFSETLNKWVYMDPTFEAFFSDEQGVLLSIEEVRARMAAGEMLLLNEEVNWNGAAKDKEDYLNYMAKNLFRFSCPVKSEFGYESKSEEQYYYELLPKGYDAAKLSTVEQRGNSRHIYISNPKFFWAKY